MANPYGISVTFPSVNDGSSATVTFTVEREDDSLAVELSHSDKSVSVNIDPTKLIRALEMLGLPGAR